MAPLFEEDVCSKVQGQPLWFGMSIAKTIILRRFEASYAIKGQPFSVWSQKVVEVLLTDCWFNLPSVWTVNLVILISLWILSSRCCEYNGMCLLSWFSSVLSNIMVFKFYLEISIRDDCRIGELGSWGFSKSWTACSPTDWPPRKKHGKDMSKDGSIAGWARLNWAELKKTGPDRMVPPSYKFVYKPH